MSTEPRIRWVASALIAVGLSTSVGAAQPSLEITVPDGPVAVGDRIPVRVLARGQDGMWGELTVRITPDGPWAVVDGPREIEGSRPPAWDMTLVPLRVEELKAPEVATTWRAGDGTVHQVEIDALPTITVASVLPPDQEVEPAPLRAPIGVSGVPWEWAVPILLVLLPALAFQHWWLRRRRDRAGADVEPWLSPLEQLEALARELQGAVQTIPREQMCDRLASGFRRYLERRTGEPALEMTSFELRVLARDSRWPESMQRATRRVMEVVDGVRFGRRPTPEAELSQVITAAVDAARELERHLAPEPEDLETAMEVAS